MSIGIHTARTVHCEEHTNTTATGTAATLRELCHVGSTNRPEKPR